MRNMPAAATITTGCWAISKRPGGEQTRPSTLSCIGVLVLVLQYCNGCVDNVSSKLAIKDFIQRKNDKLNVWVESSCWSCEVLAIFLKRRDVSSRRDVVYYNSSCWKISNDINDDNVKVISAVNQLQLYQRALPQHYHGPETNTGELLGPTRIRLRTVTLLVWLMHHPTSASVSAKTVSRIIVMKQLSTLTRWIHESTTRSGGTRANS